MVQNNPLNQSEAPSAFAALHVLSISQKKTDDPDVQSNRNQIKLNIVSATLLKTNPGFFSHAVGLTSGKAKNKGNATLGWMNQEKHSFSSKRHICSGKTNSGRVLSTKLEEYHSKTITNGAVGED